MTVSTEIDHNEYIGNGVTTSFPYTFRIFQKSDLAVQVVDLNENIRELILDTDYTVTGAGGYSGGSVVLTSPLTANYQIAISRELPVTQETDLRNQGKFFAEVHEDAFDKLTMLLQQVRSWLNLALRKPSFAANYYDALNNYIRNLRDPSRPQDAATKNYVDSLASTNLGKTLRTPESIPQLPDAATRANKMPAFDNAGNPIVVLPPSGSASDVLIELAKPTGAGLVGAVDANGDQSSVAEELNKTAFLTKDFLVAAFFQDANNQGFKLFKTPDGANFTRINKNELISSDGTFPAGRDICLYYFDDKWYAALTGGTKDFLLYRSDDLVYWEKFECNAGPTTLRWQPGSVIGGTISQINPIWAPSITEVNGELYVELSIANKPLMTEITGNTVDYLSVFSCRCNNIENLTFDMPVLMLPDDVSHYDQDFTQAPDGSWVCTTANTYSHKLEIWTAASYFGPYTLVSSVQVAGVFTEGPSIVRLNSSNKWRVYVDAYQDNGTCYYVDSADLTTWTTAIRAQIPWAVRHGTIRNLSNNANAAKAINSYSKAESLMMTDTLEPCWNFPQVTASATIVPRLNHVYRVGNSQVTLTIDEYGGDYFWVVNTTGSPGFGVIVRGSKVDGIQTIGYGQTHQTIFKFVYNKTISAYEVVGKTNDRGVEIKLNTIAGWPTITNSFKPSHGTTYSASASDSSNTTIASLPTDMPDGTFFHLMYSGGSGSSRNITIKANGSGIGIYEADVVLSGPNGNGDKIYTLKKISGAWRLIGY